MKNVKSLIRRIVSFAAAAVLALAAVPAALAVPGDWAEMQIVLNWTDPEGNTRSYPATPV